MVDNPSFQLILPEIILIITGLVVLVVDLYSKQKRALAFTSMTGIVVALASLWFAAQTPDGEYWGRMLRADPFSHFGSAIFLIVAALVILLSVDYVEKKISWAPVEFYEVLIFSTLGMLLMTTSRDLIAIYIGLELSSQTSYVLAALLRKDKKSNEAGIKYFLNGALASAVLLYGLSLIYGLTGSTYLPDIAAKLGTMPVSQGAGPLLYAAVVFCIGGFGFKIAAVPFHFWAPDAYEGAPTPITGFFSVGPKGAAFTAILRTFVVGFTAFPALSYRWTILFAILALTSMFVGNLTALWQTNVKRMMAYSSIAQAGYILTGVAAASMVSSGGERLGVEAVLYYVLGYAVSNLGIFAIITAVENAGGDSQISSFAGLAKRNPALAWSMTLLFLSLIGIPPTVGFFGKLLLIEATWGAGFWWLAAGIALNSVISVGYYYGIVKAMFFDEGPASALGPGAPAGAAVALSVIGTVVLGLAASPSWGYAQLASRLIK